jgi:hypothetical protein
MCIAINAPKVDGKLTLTGFGANTSAHWTAPIQWDVEALNLDGNRGFRLTGRGTVRDWLSQMPTLNRLPLHWRIPAPGYETAAPPVYKFDAQDGEFEYRFDRMMRILKMFDEDEGKPRVHRVFGAHLCADLDFGATCVFEYITHSLGDACQVPLIQDSGVLIKGGPEVFHIFSATTEALFELSAELGLAEDNRAYQLEAALARALLRPVEPDPPGDSPIEKAFAAEWRKQTGAFPPHQVPIGPYRVDFCVGKTVIELDGHEFHSSKEARTKDAARDRFLMQHGYRVVRFTGSEVHADVSACVRQARVLV